MATMHYMDYSTQYLTAARAEALFVSDLSACGGPTKADVIAAIRHSVRVYGGLRGCAGEVAAAYGDHPEIAAPRMRWARGVVETMFAKPSPRPRSRPGPTHWVADAGDGSSAAVCDEGATCGL
jgi:hypothetical protein